MDLTIIAMVVAAVALGLNLYTQLWLNILKPFRLHCVIQGVVWRAPLNPSITPFAIMVSVVLANKGAKPGAVYGALVRLVNPLSHQELRLEAVAQVDVARELRLANVKNESVKAQALQGIGAFIPLAKYESKNVGLLFGFPPGDAQRFVHFARPEQFWVGECRLELWCALDSSGKWVRCHDTGVTVSQDLVKHVATGQPAVNLSGALYDTAPGAPASSNKPPRFRLDLGDRVRVRRTPPEALAGISIVAARWRFMELSPFKKREDQIWPVPENYYLLRPVDAPSDYQDLAQHIVRESNLEPVG